MARVDENRRSRRRRLSTTTPPPAEVVVAASPELVANSLGEYLHASVRAVRSGDTGVLPVILGLFLISVIFQSLNSHFLTAGNLVNLLVQGAVFMLLAMGEVFVLLLGEIDLSAGFVAGLGGVIAAELVKRTDRLAVVGGDLGRPAGVRGNRRVPGNDHHPDRTAFVRRHARRSAGWQGVMLLILGTGEGLVQINDDTINNFANGILTPAAGWIIMILIVAGFGAMTWFQRRSAGVRADSLLRLSA